MPKSVVVWVMAMFTAFALVVSPADAQQDEEGLLDVRIQTAFASLVPVSLEPLGETLSRAGLSQDCRILIFDDLTEVRVPDGTQPLNLSSLRALKRMPVTQDGTLLLYLPAGRYAVVNSYCIPVSTGNPFSRTVVGSLSCCPSIEADPPYQSLTTESGDWVASYQTVDVVAGGRTRLTVEGLPEQPVSRKKLWTTILVAVGLVAGVALIASVGILRPKFNPRSDPKNPKSLETAATERAADFDDVFGDFLKRQ
jgi:hypothetical protein